MRTATFQATALVAAFLTLLMSPRALSQETAVYAEIGCAVCHGSAGEGSAAGPSLATGALALADFVDYVRQPTGTMPAYSPQAVSNRTLAEIHAYLAPATAQRVPTGRVDAGTTLYRSTGCYQCHSNEGQGGAQGPRIGPDPVSFARFAWYLRQPTGSMPPYSAAVISDQDLADIYSYLETRPRPPAVDSIPLLAP